MANIELKTNIHQHVIDTLIDYIENNLTEKSVHFSGYTATNEEMRVFEWTTCNDDCCSGTMIVILPD